MKRLFFTASLFICLFSLSSFAAERNTPEILQSFYKTFHNAQSVNWTEVNDMLRIGFIMDGRQQFAYYSDEELVVVATEIKTEELPGALKVQLSGFKGYTVTQAYELTRDDVKEYCVVIESNTKHIVLKGKNKWKICIDEKF